MNKDIHPVAIAAVIVLLVIGVVAFGYHALQPAPYTPSPGSIGASASAPGSTGASAPAPGTTKPVAQPSSDPPNYYPATPAGATPGKPLTGNN